MCHAQRADIDGEHSLHVFHLWSTVVQSALAALLVGTETTVLTLDTLKTTPLIQYLL